MDAHSMAYEVLYHDRYKPVFLNMWTLVREQDKKWHKNNIMVQSSKFDIILHCQIKSHDGWVVEVEFLWETHHERAQLAMSSTKKDIHRLHA